MGGNPFHDQVGVRELQTASDQYSEWYDPAQLDALVDRLREDYSERRLRDHPTLDWFIVHAATDEGA